MKLSTEFKEYLGGFIDGDGCFRMNDIDAVQFYLSQAATKCPEILKKMHSTFGGKLRDRCRRIKKDYELIISSQRELLPLLRIGKKYCALKSDQAEVLYNYVIAIHERKEKKLNAELLEFRHKSYLALKNMKKLESYQNVKIDAKRVTPAYVAGLMDAEGCIDWDGTIRVQISQKSNAQLLQCIKDRFQMGNITSTHYKVYGTNANIFLSQLVNYTTMKRQQIEVVLRMREIQEEAGMCRRKTKQQLFELSILRQVVKFLKTQ